MKNHESKRGITEFMKTLLLSLAVAPMAQRDGVFLGGATYMPNAPKNFFTTWIDADIESDLLAKHI